MRRELLGYDGHEFEIRRAAANFINLTRKLAREGTISDTIEVGIASDDAEARSLGWPCVGAQRMSIALAAARIKDFRIVIVPRGTTPATAAAADANDAALRSED